jgi:hypothetical protein
VQLSPGFSPGSGTLWIHTEADDSSSTGEKINLNGVTVGGPIDQNLGPYASLFDLPVSNIISGSNLVNITTNGDQFAWDLAVLSSSSSVPEPGTLAICACGFLGLVAARRLVQPKK